MDKQKIGERLRAIRGDTPVAEVAKAVGVTTPAIYQYELGIRMPSDKVKMKLADYYNKTVEEIFFARDDNEL